MKTLYDVKSNCKCLVKSVPNAVLLEQLGVFEGAVITKKQSYKFGGPCLIEVYSREVAIGKEIAVCIEVEELQECEEVHNG